MSDEIALGSTLFGEPLSRTRDEIREEVTQLYERRRDAVFRSVLACIRNPAIAEELTQEAFFRLYQHFIAGNVVEKAVSWTLAVARNLAIDRLREGKCEQSVSEESWHMLLETHTGGVDSFEQILISRDTHTHLLALVEVLPVSQRSCVQLYAKGLTFKEISETLRIPYPQALLQTRDGLQRIKRLAGQKRS